MSYTGGTIEYVYPYHDPNQGREIWNKNFQLLDEAVHFSLSGSSTGNTVVQSGDDNIVVTTSGITIPPVYVVSISDDVIFNSISGGTIYSGGTDLYDIFTTTSASGATSASTLSQVLSIGDEIGVGQLMSGAGTSNIFKLNETGSAILLDTDAGNYRAGIFAENDYIAMFGANWGPAFEAGLTGLKPYISAYSNGASLLISDASGKGGYGLSIGNNTLDFCSGDVEPIGARAGFLMTDGGGIESGTTSSIIIASNGGNIGENGGNNAIIGSNNAIVLSGINHSVIIGGENITGSSSNTVYVPRLVATRTDEAALNLPVLDISFTSTTQGDVWITTGATSTFINVYVGGVVKSVELT